MSTVTYDPKCYDVARDFLADHAEINDACHADELAQSISLAIDGYIEAALEDEKAMRKGGLRGMTTTKAAARAFLDANYPSTRSMPLDWAIAEARRLYRNDRAYYAGLNDEATLRYEAQGEPWREVSL